MPLACFREPPLPGRGHRYGVQTTLLFCQFVLRAACSLRSASAVLKLLVAGDERLRMPAANTGQMWLLQLGLYELRRPKEAANDWVWLVDHAVQMGTLRCLVIVGCRASAWRTAGRPLEQHDLSLFALEPVEKSNGRLVAEQLAAVSAATGIVPQAILSDQGSDLKNGVSTYIQDHPETLLLNDIAHRTANEMKRELEADARWKDFLVATGKAKQRLIMTPLAHLVPPKLRSKARYMNLQELVTWGEKTLCYLDDPHPVAGQLPDRAALRAKLGWLEDYRSALRDWGSALRVVATTLTYVRTAGYHPRAAAELGPQLCPAPTPIAQRITERLLHFLATQGAQFKPTETFPSDQALPGSTEVLESLIGKGKRLEGQRSQSGFTRMILGLAAAVARPCTEYLTDALTTITNQDVHDWCQQHLGISLAAQRRQALLSPAGTDSG